MIDKLAFHTSIESLNFLNKQNIKYNDQNTILNFDELYISKSDEFKQNENDHSNVEFEIEYENNNQNQTYNSKQDDIQHVQNDNEKNSIEKQIKQIDKSDGKIEQKNKKVSEKTEKHKNIGIKKDKKNKKNIIKNNDLFIISNNFQSDNTVLKNPEIIKIRYKELDLNTKIQIDDVLKKFKSGKISENEANSFIAQIIKNTGSNKLRNIKKTKNFKIKIINNLPGEKNKLNDVKFSDTKNFPGEKKQNDVLLNIKNNKNIFITSQNQKNKFVKNKLNIKEPTVGNKDIKSEIKLDLNNNKIIDNFQFKNNTTESKKILDNNKQQIFRQIVRNTKIILAQNQTKFSTMIRPEEFGRIDFKFLVKDGKLNGRVILQNQETADFFKSNIEELRAVMQKSNVELENVEIILAGNKFGENTGDADKQFEDRTFDDFTLSKGVKSTNNNIIEENLQKINNLYINSNSNINVVI